MRAGGPTLDAVLLRIDTAMARIDKACATMQRSRLSGLAELAGLEVRHERLAETVEEAIREIDQLLATHGAAQTAAGPDTP